MEINPIYKFMKDNGLTQKDEATFVSEYSNPQKSAELHKFMTDNGLTTKGADDFYSQYFNPSKKKVSTDSSEPAEQRGEPSAPSFGQKITEKITNSASQTQVPLKTGLQAQEEKKAAEKKAKIPTSKYFEVDIEEKQDGTQAPKFADPVVVAKNSQKSKAIFNSVIGDKDIYKMPTAGESKEYATDITSGYLDYLEVVGSSKSDTYKEKYKTLKAKSKADRTDQDEKFLRQVEAEAVGAFYDAKEWELSKISSEIDNLEKTAVTDEEKAQLNDLYGQYEKKRNSLIGTSSVYQQNKLQYGKIAGTEMVDEEAKLRRFEALQAGDGKTIEFFKGIGGAVANGVLSIGQVPKVFGDLIGDKDYDWSDQMYDMVTGQKSDLDREFGAPLPQGKNMSDLPLAARLAVVGGNAIGSAGLFAAGGGLIGATSNIGKAAATFGTAFLTSESGYYQEALDAGMSPQEAALAGTYLAAQTALIESIIPDIKYFEPSAFRKSIMQGVSNGIKSGLPVKEAAKLALKNAIKAVPESGITYGKTAIKEAGEELLGQIGEDVGKLALNAAGQRQYFNDTFNGEAYEDAILGGFIAGGGMSVFSRPTPKSPIQEEVMREIVERRPHEKMKGTASDKINKLDLSNIDEAVAIYDAMSSHSGWNVMSREEQNHALALAQQAEVMKKEQDRMKELRIPDERKDAEIKKLEDEVNQMFSMQMEQDKEKAKDAKLKAIEDEFNKSMEGEEFPVQEDERDQEIVELQKQREERGVNEVDTLFSDMKPMVPFAVERMEQGQPVAQSVKQAASNYLYKKYKELTNMKSDPNRMMTRQQISNVQKQLEQDIRTLEGTAEVKQQVDDQENIQGVPSEIGVGQEPIAAQPIEVTSEEAPATGGVLQAQGQEEVVTPQVTEEPTPKPTRKTRLAKIFETSDGEEAVPLIEQSLSESGIKVEVKDDADYNDDDRIKRSQGRGSEGMFVADDGTIILNRDKIKGEWGKTIVFHEGIHPVINIIRNTDPKRYRAIVDGLKAEATRNNAVAKAAADIAASEEYQRRGPESIEDETVVETMARVATGDIDINTFKPSFREKFIEFMNDIAKAFGLRPILTNSPQVEVKRLAEQINKMLNEGGKISDVVGKKNIGEFQNTIGTPTSIVQPSNLNRAPKVKVNPNGHSLSFVQPSDIKDISSLIKEIADKDQKVWFWVADQLGRGLYFDSVVDGYHFLDAGPSFALDPENRNKNIIWATGKNQKEIEKLMGQTDYIFIISGSPQLSKLFNKKISEVVFNRIEKAIMDRSADKKIDPFNKFKKEILGVSKVSSLNSILNSVNSFDELLNSPKRKQFLIDMLDQQSKQTPLKKLFEKYNAFVDLNEFRDGFYADNNFELNDVMLVLQPTGFGGTSKHSTYENDVLGNVIGVPDRKINAYDIMTDEFKSKYGEMPRTQQQQTVAPYGIGVRSVQPSKGILRGKRPTKADVDKYLSEQEFFRSTSPFAWAVDPVSEETLKKSRIVENEGTYGVVTEDGDIKGVFNPNAAKQREGVPAKKNTLAGLIPKAINAGGIKLDNFDGRLTELYSKNGFRKVSSVPFNEEYAPEGWSKEKDGTPDVVSMVYDPDNKLDIEFKKFDDYGDMISYRDSFVDQARKEVDKKWGEKKVITLTKRDELGTKADREIAAYASKFLNKFGPYTKANVIQIMNMSAEEKIKLINDTFEAKFKNRKPEPGDPEDYFYEQGVKRRDEVLALVTKPIGQPSMVKRTPALASVLDLVENKKITDGPNKGLTQTDTASGPFVSESGNAPYSEPSGVREQTVREGGVGNTVKAVWNKYNQIKFNGSVKVKDAEDVAHIMRKLEDKSVEHAFAVHVDKSGKAHIQFLGMGGPTSTVVDPRLVLSGAKKFKSKKVYLVHNHPSGSLVASKPDMQLTNKVDNALRPLGIELEHIIMDTYKKQYVHLYPDDISLIKNRDITKESIEEYNKALKVEVMDEQKILSEPVEAIKSSKDVSQFLMQVRFTALPKHGMLLLNNKNEIIGNYIFKKGFDYNEATSFIAESGVGTAVIFYSNQDQFSSGVKPMINSLESADIKVFDYVIINSDSDGVKGYYQSYTDQGKLRETQTEYGTNSIPKPTIQPSVVKRTPSQVRQAVEDGVDAVEAAIAEGMDPQQAVDENISNQDWYGDLNAAQKEQLNEILQDEFGATASEPKAKTPVGKQIASIVDNYYKLKDGDRSARAAINEILGSDPKLKYIYDNISKINKQLQDAGVITDKTDGCP